jgi:hypothetical protein
MIVKATENKGTGFHCEASLPLTLNVVAADVRRLILLPGQKVRASSRRLLQLRSPMANAFEEE